MSLADLLPRAWPAGRLPGGPGGLRGPASGVILLPRHLSLPGMRECDVSDDRARRAAYGLLLAQGSRSDIARFVNGGLLRRDWPLIRGTMSPWLRRACERRLGLAAGDQPAGDPPGRQPARRPRGSRE